MNTMTRRSLLALGCGAACAQVLGCGPSAQLAASISAGPASAFALDSLVPLSGQGVAIGRDAAGLYALSLICTHQGCDLSQDGSVSFSGLQCICHGARFDAQGTVLQGPARSDLPHFLVTKDASGTLTIHTDQQVAASVRQS